MSEDHLSHAPTREGGDGPPAPTHADDAPTHRPLGPNRSLILGIWAALAVAAAAAAYLLRSYLMSTWGPEAFESACNFSEAFNCDRINTSDWGKLQDLPLTVYALPSYCAMAALAWLGAGTGGKGRAALRLLQVASAGAVAYGLFLFFVMVAIEQTYCVFCLTMDGAALAVLVLSSLALARLGPATEEARWSPAVLVATVVGGALFGCTVLWYGDTKDALVAEQIAQVDATNKATDAAIAAAAAQPPAADAPAAPPPQSGSGPGSTYTGAAKKIAGNKYVVPVHEEDPALGPVDAKVTVVEYADFQCPYCKKLFYVLEALKKRFATRSVRFVFKHFPMNTLCNKHVENNRHPYACNASLAAECARRQGRFWDLYEVMFKNQHKLTTGDLRYYVKQINMNFDGYVACMRAPEPRATLQRQMDEAALGLGLSATPRTFVNGTLYEGAVSMELLSHAIEEELRKAGADATPSEQVANLNATAAAVVAPGSAGGAQVRVRKASGLFWIDAYEGAIDAEGRALSLPNVMPANTTWAQARTACVKAGKRLCTSEEWVTACQGTQAVDDDKDGDFANDYVEGNQFPYADYFEEGWCRVNEDRIKGRAGATATMSLCHTATGIYDMAGNVEEWIGADQDSARLAGGDFRVKEKGGCYRAHDSFGPGHRNHSTGFRCCSDKPVTNASSKPVPHVAPDDLVGQPLPAFKANAMDGRGIDPGYFLGKVTLVSFFASWCTPCRHEMPALKELVKEIGADGFQVLAIGVDTEEEAAQAFIKPVEPNYPVILDSDARILGLFDVQNMPTSYLVDKRGQIILKLVGFGDKTLEELRPAVAAHLVVDPSRHPTPPPPPAAPAP